VTSLSATTIELPALRARVHVFEDRTHAGCILADMLEAFRDTGALVLAIPAGGVPVATVIARTLQLPLEVAVVSKILLPWNTEVGYGAIAYDGTVRLNERLIKTAGLSDEVVKAGIETTIDKVARRAKRLRGDQPWPELTDRPVILVDDGLASGFTMRAAVDAAKGQGANHVVVAVPTGHADKVKSLAGTVQGIYCPNVRTGQYFAVANAYAQWSDVPEQEMVDMLVSGGCKP
jgi:putative phosphoribosyl transferase